MKKDTAIDDLENHCHKIGMQKLLSESERVSAEVIEKVLKRINFGY
jgi:hypothetical protein